MQRLLLDGCESVHFFSCVQHVLKHPAKTDDIAALQNCFGRKEGTGKSVIAMSHLPGFRV